ncbi:MAG: rRNA maturation RNase YbeY [Nitrospiraceae bacterium]
MSRLARDILAAAGEPDAEVSLDLVGDRRMQRLNRQYRGRDYPTDVLAFPMREAKGPASPLLGDVVISLHAAARQSAAGGRPIEQALATLLVHGILHLVGYDHERGAREARRMRRKERFILKSLRPVPRMIEARSLVSPQPSGRLQSRKAGLRAPRRRGP